MDMNDEQKKQEFLKNKKDIIKLFESVQQAPLDEIKKNLESLSKKTEDSVKSIFTTYKEGNGKTVLHFAASRGDIEILRYMIENGADINVVDESGNTPVFVAVQHGNLPVVKFFIDEQNFDAKKTRKGDVSLLHLACSIGQVDLIDYLISKGLDINASSDMGSPIEVVTTTNNVDAIEFVLSKGANPNGSQGSNIPPPLILAISFQSQKLFGLLLDTYKADPNGKDMQGWSALQFSAETGQIDFCKRLLAKGADPNYECQGQTAIDLAFQEEKMEAVELLRPLTTKSIQSKTKREPVKQEVQDDSEVNEEEAAKLKAEGNSLYSQSKYEEAMVKYDESLKYNRKTKAAAAVYTNKAICQILLKRPEDALKTAQLAKSVDQGWVKAYIREGQAYYQLNEYGEAAATYFEALKMDPQNADIRALFNEAVKRGKQAHATQSK